MNLTTDPTALELDDIQNGAIRARPSPYVGVYFLLRIDDRQAGRELLRRLLPALASATNPADRGKQAWVTAGLTFQGLKALGVPQDSLDSFPAAFQQGMAARAELLGDVGENGPHPWDPPLAPPDVRVALAALSPAAERLEPVVQKARAAYHLLPGVEAIWRQDV